MNTYTTFIMLACKYSYDECHLSDRLHPALTNIEYNEKNVESDLVCVVDQVKRAYAYVGRLLSTSKSQGIFAEHVVLPEINRVDLLVRINELMFPIVGSYRSIETYVFTQEQL